MGPAASTPKKDAYADRLKSEKWYLDGQINRQLYNSDNTRILTNLSDANIDNNPSSVVDATFGDQSGLKEKVRVYSKAASTLKGRLDSSNDDKVALTEKNELLASLPISNYSISFIEVETQNKLIDNQINNIKQEYSTDTQKVNYQSEKIYTLKKINYVLFIMYYFLVLIFILVLLMYNTTFTKYFKILIVIIFLLFPFTSDILYQLIVYLYNYIHAMLNGNAYTSNNY